MKTTTKNSGKKLIFILVLIQLVFTSCSPVAYFPTTINPPLLREKNEYLYSIGSDLFTDTFKHHYSGQLAYAISDHLFVQTTIQLDNTMVLSDVEVDTSITNDSGILGLFFGLLLADYDFSTQTNLYTESSLGYYTTFRENYIFEAQIGAGWGGSRIGEALMWNWDYIDSYKIFSQIDIGVREKYFDFGFGYRLSYLNQYKIQYQDELLDMTTQTYWEEPFVFLSAGQEKYGKISIRAGFEIPHEINIGEDWRMTVSPFWWTFSLNRSFQLFSKRK